MYIKNFSKFTSKKKTTPKQKMLSKMHQLNFKLKKKSKKFRTWPRTPSAHP